jgi:hypothetical protein
MNDFKNYCLEPKINKKEAQNILKNYFKQSWFSPYSLKTTLNNLDNIEAHFLHFIMYDVELNYQSYDKEIRTKTIRDLLIHNSNLLSEKEYEMLLPINITNLSEIDIDKNESFIFEKNDFNITKLKKKLEQEIVYEIDENIEVDTFKNKGTKEHKVSVLDKNIILKNLFVPVYLVHFEFENNKYKFLVNGLTGDILAKPLFSKNRLIITILTSISLILVLVFFIYLI